MAAEKSKLITVNIDDKPVEIELMAVRKSGGLQRAELMGQAGKSDMPELKKQVAFFLYPTCICAVKNPDWVRELTLDEFIDRVDEADMELWNATAYDVNPQWRTGMQMLASITSEEAEKKISTPSNGSTPPTEPKQMTRSRKH